MSKKDDDFVKKMYKNFDKIGVFTQCQKRTTIVSKKDDDFVKKMYENFDKIGVLTRTNFDNIHVPV